ncbi:MAG: chemotaxis protein CheC [Psychrobium sp.]|nr:chemotaxis protein CheC [Psychrobium sp.]
MSESIMSDDYCDTLCELFNIGMGRAAASLSEMIDEEVLLSVPSLEAVSYRDAMEKLHEQSPDPIDVVEQYFDGDFSGSAFLFFGDQSSLELVRRILGESYASTQLGELEQEALKEVSNIILNACFGCIAEVLDCEIESGVPVLLRGNVGDILDIERMHIGKEPLVLTLSMSFSLPDNLIQGQVSLLMTSESIRKLIRELEQYTMLYT